MPFGLSGQSNQNNKKRWQQPFSVSKAQASVVGADHLGISTQPANVTSGAVFSSSPVVQALRPDTSVDTNYSSNIVSTITSGTPSVRTTAVFTSANSEWLDGGDLAKAEFAGVHLYISAWVYLTTNASTIGIATKMTTGGNQREFSLSYVTGTGLRFSVSPDGTAGVTSATFSSNASTGTWYFVEGWHVNGVELGIRVNRGTPVYASFTSGMYAGTRTGKLAIGASSGGTGAYLNGRIANLYMATSETMTWQSILSGASLPDETISADLYNGGVIPYGTELDAATIAAAKRTGGSNGELLFLLNEASGARSNYAATISLTDNNTVTSSASGESITLANVALSGDTEAAVAGEATFDALTINRPVADAKLTFSSGALTNVVSDTFQVA